MLADGEPVNVGARAFDLLQVLIDKRDRVVGHGELFERVWPGLVVDENNLRQHVSSLRKLLGASAVSTVPGRGYRFGLLIEDAPAQEPEAPSRDSATVRDGVRCNLPRNKPALIGRESDLAEVIALLAETQLLTIVGAGGVGKTRLALEVADTVRTLYPDGVCFVELAPVTEASLVPKTVAAALDVHEQPGRSMLDTLLDFFRNRRMLIVLDNCEHLIESCARYAEQVLRSTEGTRTLATSREAMSIAGEVAWRLPSLRTARPDAGRSPEQLLEFAATRLFMQRATAASPRFRLTLENAAAVATICHQLDGIPLALELAAARVATLRVEQVAERLHDRFALLTRGHRTALLRHQTLRSLIDWSHGLLSEAERGLLRRLAVFAGGWSLEAAEKVCSDDPTDKDDVLDLLAQLVEKSLVVLDLDSDEPRYRLLETIREYGLEKLADAREVDATRTRHLRYFVDLADTIRPMLTRDEQLHWHARAETELDNFRMALKASQAPGHAELGLRLFSSLTRFWYKNMHWKEMVDSQERLSECSERDGRPASLHDARSLYGSAMLATNFDPPLGRRLCAQCLDLSRSLAFDEGIAWALMWMGYMDTSLRDPATADLFAESLRAGRRIEDPWRRAFLLAQMLICYAGYEALMGRDASAEAMVAECEAEMSKIGGDKLYVGHGRALLGTIAIRRGDFDRANELLAESLDLYRSVESGFDIAGSLAQQGFLAQRQGEPARALSLFKQSLPLHRNYPMSPWVTKGLAHLLIAYAACDRWEVAARLAGALGGAVEGALGASGDRKPADATRCPAPTELAGRVRQAYEEAVARTRGALDESVFARHFSIGARMTREQAIALALEG